MLQASIDYIRAAATPAIWAASWPSNESRNDPGNTHEDRWPAPAQIHSEEPADQYTDRRYDPATDDGAKRPDEDRTFWDRL